MTLVLKQVMLAFIFFTQASGLPIPAAGKERHPDGVSDAMAISAILDQQNQQAELCSYTTIFLDDLARDTDYITSFVETLNSPGGVAVFRANVSRSLDPFEDKESEVRSVVSKATEIRKVSLCSTVLVAAQNSESLASLASGALETRLLSSYSKLLVISDLLPATIKVLMQDHYTLGWMHTVFLNREKDRYSTYTYLPFTPNGPAMVRTATFSSAPGTVAPGTLPPVFLDKFRNFHGQTVNVTALPYPPYWNAEEETDPNGDTVVRYSGSDFEMISAISTARNFHLNVMECANWNEVTERVQDRQSLVASVIYSFLSERVKLYDFTELFNYAEITFCLRNPALKPSWQALYYPLSNEVWLAVLITIIFVTFPFTLVNFNDCAKPDKFDGISSTQRMNVVTETVVATLLNQTLPKSFPKTSNSSRILLGAWLTVAFVIATVYRSNLTASLTLPRYPFKIETLSQLVATGRGATMPPYGDQFKQFFVESSSPDYQKLGDSMEIVQTVDEGMNKAMQEGTAHIDARMYIELQIAQKFSNVFGVQQMYIARDYISPGLSSWPIVHDAPYKKSFDEAIRSIIEAGLYIRWRQNQIDEVRRKSRLKKLEELKKKAGQDSDTPDTDQFLALTLVHMQGPFILLGLGWLLGLVSFVLELVNLLKNLPKTK